MDGLSKFFKLIDTNMTSNQDRVEVTAQKVKDERQESFWMYQKVHHVLKKEKIKGW